MAEKSKTKPKGKGGKPGGDGAPGGFYPGALKDAKNKPKGKGGKK